MKHLILTAFALLSCTITIASPIAPSEGQAVGKTFLLANKEIKGSEQLSLAYAYPGSDGNATIYVYNIEGRGFILVSADDQVEPILGYSLHGTFDTARLSPNFRNWIECYRADIDAIVQGQSQLSQQNALAAAAEWTALREEDYSYYDAQRKGNVEPLMTSYWDQGGGYNNYCPTFAGGPNGHSYVGCVATAMAQIIRYHGYPASGFGTSSYSHRYYGRQTANHDSVVYNFAQMPDYVSLYSSSTQQNAVSLLCYHCGVSVKMNYQNVDHTSGSGAQTEDAVEGLKHFGYFNARYAMMAEVGDENWKALLRNELDHQRPILYSARESTESGHAFVCDGYRSSNNKFHFNWGWSGYQDGFFTLTNMNGFTRAQSGVYNIYPSGIGSGFDVIYVADDGQGDGSSWQQATSQLNDAIQARGIYKSGQVWVKEGTYYGDSTRESVIQLKNGVRLYGGFGGTESAIGERNGALHPTILDGQNEHSIVETENFTKTTQFKDFILQNGISSNTAAIHVSENLSVSKLVIRQCTATEEGLVAWNNGGTFDDCEFYDNQADSANGYIYGCIDGANKHLLIRNNQAAAAVCCTGGKLYSSLISHNDGIGVLCDHKNSVVCNCDITYNSGTGLSLANAKEIRNNIIYQNGTAIDSLIPDIVRFCATDSEMPLEENGNLFIDESTSLFWMDMSPRGRHEDGLFDAYSWHLKSDSPCFNGGDTITQGIPDKDLDGNPRINHGRIDIGCYELAHLSIEQPEETAFSVFPNPSRGNSIHLSGPENADYLLLDLYGRIVMSWEKMPAQGILDLQALPRGIYILRSGNSSLKIVRD